MSKLGRILKIGSEVGKPFMPGLAGSVLDIVTHHVAGEDDSLTLEALKTLAGRVDECEHAILILHERLEKLGAK